jgi:hypothetical protein
MTRASSRCLPFVLAYFGASFAVACGGTVTATSVPVDGGSDGASPPAQADAAASPPPQTDAAPSPAAQTDAAVSPPAADATPTPSDAPSCEYCFLHALSWGYTGGEVAFVETSTLGSCVSYTYSRTPVGSSTPQTLTCSTDISNCTSISIRDVDGALANADVVAALASKTLLYGSDSRPCDGAVLDIRVDGAEVEVGGECGPGDAGAGCGLPGACTPVPPGLRALATLLTQLDKQELAVPPCSTTFP